MELSLFLEKFKWESPGLIWSSSGYSNSDGFWSGCWHHHKAIPVYEVSRHQSELIGIFVRVRRNQLEWSRPHKNIPFSQAVIICDKLSEDNYVNYITPRAEMCDAK